MRRVVRIQIPPFPATVQRILDKVARPQAMIHEMKSV